MGQISAVLLVIIAVDYESAKAKGVLNLLAQYDEGKCFRKVILVCPYLRVNRTIKISTKIEYREFGNKFSIFKYPIHIILVIKNLLSLIKHENVAIIRATEPTIAGLFALIISRLTGIPYCISIHADYDQRYLLDGKRGAPTIFNSRLPIHTIEYVTLRYACRVFPIRTSLIPYLIRRKVELKKIGLFPHGVSLDDFKTPLSFNIHKYLNLGDTSKKIICYAGRLSSENYVHHLIDIATILLRTRNDFLIIILGNGPEFSVLTNKINENPLLKEVILMMGFKNRDDVIKLRRSCYLSICLMGGYSLIEACAGGRPVVSYDVEWHHELVINGVSGFLIEENNINEVVKSIIHMLNEPELCNVIGENAKKLAFDRHDIKKVAMYRCAQYAQLIEKSQ